MALVTKYEVRTHVDSSWLADRLPAMCCRETLAIEMSSTSMKAARPTVTAISHGLAPPGTPDGRDGIGTPYRTFTLGTTDMPGPSGKCRSGGVSKMIFTGTRCTTLTKLPVAFSGGSRLKAAPDPAVKLSTRPRNTLSG